MKNQRILEEKDELFRRVLEQWPLHEDEKWKQTWIDQAQEWKDKLQSAKLICERGESFS